MHRLRGLSRGGRLVLALAVGGAVFGIATAVQASIPDSSGVIHGCYNNSLAHGNPTGALRVIDTAKPNGNCASWETPLNWGRAVRAPPALVDRPGQLGQQGRQALGARCEGATGAKGATGSRGPTGAKGATGPIWTSRCPWTRNQRRAYRKRDHWQLRSDLVLSHGREDRGWWFGRRHHNRPRYGHQRRRKRRHSRRRGRDQRVGCLLDRDHRWHRFTHRPNRLCAEPVGTAAPTHARKSNLAIRETTLILDTSGGRQSAARSTLVQSQPSSFTGSAGCAARSSAMQRATVPSIGWSARSSRHPRRECLATAAATCSFRAGSSGWTRPPSTMASWRRLLAGNEAGVGLGVAGDDEAALL